MRGVSIDGFVAGLGIVAIDETGSGTGWRVSLGPPPTDGCLGWDARIALDFDTDDRVRPRGVVTPDTIAVYPAGDPSPVYQEHLENSARLEIAEGNLPVTLDGIGHGERIGTVKLDVRLRDASFIRGEAVLIDCAR